MKVKSESEVAQSCPTLSDPMDCSLPGSSTHGIFQARVLEWGAIAFSDESVTALQLISFFYMLLPNLSREGDGTPLQYSCLEKSHGQRSLIGCSPWDRKESDTTERLHFHFSLSCIGEGNDNPLQCSCLENPRDEGA